MWEIEVDGKECLAITIMPNHQYEIIIDGSSFYYEGSLEDLDSLDQLEEMCL